MTYSKLFRYPAWCTTKPDNVSVCNKCAEREDCDLQTCLQILEDSRGFFYTYKLLLENSRYPWFSHSGEEFEKRREANLEKVDQPSLLFPIAANGAMAVELAIKYLTYRKSHEFAETHRLYDLFNSLPQEDKGEILSRMEQRTGWNCEVVTKALCGFSNIFTEARYPFSLGNKGVAVLFDDFVRVVCDYANEIYSQELSS